MVIGPSTLNKPEIEKVTTYAVPVIEFKKNEAEGLAPIVFKKNHI